MATENGIKTKIIFFLLSLLQVISITWALSIQKTQSILGKDQAELKTTVAVMQRDFEYIAKQLEQLTGNKYEPSNHKN